MKNVEPVRDFLMEHIKSVLQEQNPLSWFEDYKTYEKICELEDDIAGIRDSAPNADVDEDSDYLDRYNEIYEIEIELKQVQDELAAKWRTAYTFITVTKVQPTSFTDDWDIGWEIVYELETDNGNIEVLVNASHKLVEVQISDEIVKSAGKKLSKSYDLHNDFDKRRMFHHLSAK